MAYVKELRRCAPAIAAVVLTGMEGVLPYGNQEVERPPSLHRLEQFIECVNEPDYALRNEFLRKAFEDQSSTALEERAGAFGEVLSSLPGLEIDKVLRSSRFQVIAHCNSENGSILEVYLETSESAPHLIEDIEFDMVKAVVSKGEYRDVPQLPENQLGRGVAALIEAVNSNELRETTEFISRHTSIGADRAAEIHDSISDAHEASGGLQFYSFRKYRIAHPDDPIVVIANARSAPSWHAIVLKAAEDGRIGEFRFAPARAPKDATANSPLTVERATKEIENYLDAVRDRGEFSGSVLVGVGDEILIHRAMGLASRRYEVPNTVGTKFNLASMNKMFTGVAICQLVEAEKISLTDTVETYLSPNWLPKEVAAKIEVRHLLTHTSGIGKYFTGDFEAMSKHRFSELDDYRELFAREVLHVDPGLRWKYSNEGMFLLGVIVEKVSGKSYFEYVRENVYRRAGMEDSGCFPIDEPIPDLAIGYYLRDGRLVSNTHKIYRGGPAGGGYSTTGDLFKFSRALVHNRLMSAGMTSGAISAKPELKSPNYGYGFQVRPEFDLDVIGHSGGDDGIVARMDVLPGAGMTIVVLSNFDTGDEAVSNRIRGIASRVVN